jgi:hypothetical protein
MAINANFAGTPKVGAAVISAANTALDGTGTVPVVFTAGASGSRLDSVTVKALTTTVNGMVRLFLHNGTTFFLLTEIEMMAATSSTTTKSAENGITLNIVIPTGWSLRASTSIAQSYNVIAIGGDF